ncbi:hypothetical protein PPROV_000278400 [Pycnococcus provasolii]|uniref:Oxidoreductase molybdopterin-binding domain-containing protein n=1 Tax=Pycnococcus provasolii TaxID=41880 RepID=A0A830HDY8_9CHLO|nr:hypothetical protein PPROV_000278400 [Pycnococcus provasolii]
MDESKFRRHRVKAVLQCSGNRRSEAQREARELELPDPQGLPWKQGAIANVEWEGVLLADVLRAAGVVPEKKMMTTNDGYERHVQFAGADVPRVGDWKDETGFYGASIPLRHALDVNREVLVAFRMSAFCRDSLLVDSCGSICDIVRHLCRLVVPSKQISNHQSVVVTRRTAWPTHPCVIFSA